MLTAEDIDGRECFAYRCLMRPPGPGAVPADGLSFCTFREGTTLGGKHFWGSVVYNRKLTPEEIDRYELEPTPLVVVD